MFKYMLMFTETISGFFQKKKFSLIHCITSCMFFLINSIDQNTQIFIWLRNYLVQSKIVKISSQGMNLFPALLTADFL